MAHPFQSLVVGRRSTTIGEVAPLIIAACGSTLVVSSAHTGRIVSQWSASIVAQPSAQSEQQPTDQQSVARPAKKQKTWGSSIPKQNIIKLAVSPDGNYVVAVTDDKYVRVFEIKDRGELLELSQRCMPKRPCAIHVLPDNATILCGDKFGDIYSLPLIAAVLADTKPSDGLTQSQVSKTAQPFKSIATVKTVHTQGNRRALESQQNQRNLTPRSKEPLGFEHQLLLGHVSMLTDLVYATRLVDGHERKYIISTDRDEHIRASRGPPQSHIIEGYCLGHTNFVSKICVIPGHDLLISGGGDDWLGVWDWSSFKLRRKIEDFGSRVRHIMRMDPSFQSVTERIAVSGIWLVPVTVGGEHTELAIAVACERVPILATILVTELLKGRDSNEIRFSVHGLANPVIDLAVSDGSVVVISFDVRDSSEPRLRAYRFSALDSDCSDEISQEPTLLMNEHLKDLNAVGVKSSNDKEMDDLLYGIGNLRKWSGRTGEEDTKDEDE